MTTHANERIPAWTRGDRLRKARVQSGMSTRDFAAMVGVSTKTISDAENDKRATRRILINAWALATGVPVEWLMDGTESAPDPDPTGARGVNVQYLDSPPLAMPQTPPRPALVAA